QPNLRSAETLLQTLLCYLISLDAGQTIRIRKVTRSREGPRTTKILRRGAGDAYGANAGSELHVMVPSQHRRDVCNLETILCVGGQSFLEATAGKSLLHVDCRNRVVRSVSGCLMIELKARLVDCLFVENCSFRQTRRLLCRESFENP